MLRNELEKHLSPLKRQGLIEAWHDRRIVAGQEFNGEIDRHNGEIDRHFEEADIILLLVSSDFINSDYCYDIEMKRAVERHELGHAVVIPVILRPCHWHDLPFGKLLAATPDGKPVTQYPSLDDGFFQVVSSIKGALKTLAKSAGVEPVTPGGLRSRRPPFSELRQRRPGPAICASRTNSRTAIMIGLGQNVLSSWPSILPIPWMS